MRAKLPQLPDPARIKSEIDDLTARVRELRGLLQAAEIQQLARKLRPMRAGRKRLPQGAGS